MTGSEQAWEVYQFRVFLWEISPLIWRRLLLRSDQTLADLHYAIQIGFGWSDFHLHRFTFRCGEYGISRARGPWYTEDARHIRLADLRLRVRERFTYEYDFGDEWIHELRLEQRLPLNPGHTYPECIGGAREGPPEDCGGPWRFMALRQHFNIFYINERLAQILDEKIGEVDPEEIVELRYWAGCDHFDRRAVNRRLRSG